MKISLNNRLFISTTTLLAIRDDVFSVVSLKKYPFIANSDFHKPRHLYSWKTLLSCEKDIESVKQCIRVNRRVAITLFRKQEVHM